MIKSFLYSAVTVFAGIWGVQAHAAACSAQKIQEILQPASKKNSSVQIDCSVTLPKDAQVTKQMVFAGQQASGTVLDCQGASIQATHAKPSLLITSLLKNSMWDVPQHIQIKNCSINGSLRIHGMAANGEGDYLRESSHREGHTHRAQQAAPQHISLQHLTLSSDSNILYIAPGVQYVTLKDSRFHGATNGLAVYLDAESANNSIENNTFNVQTRSREIIAIDGSASNLIRDNTFVQPAHGGIFLYRNCGEGGTVRHQTPSANQIISNHFELGRTKDKSPLIWLGSRNGHRKYCGMDSGYAFGSSGSDNDLAQNNVVRDNTFVLPKIASAFFWNKPKQGEQNADDQDNLIRVDSQPNQVLHNKSSN